MPDDPELRRILWHLLGASRGGENRARIINELRTRPCNLNQITQRLGLQYRSIQHHIEVLRRNSLVTSQGEKYGTTYFVSPVLEANIGIFEEICKKLKFVFDSSISEKENLTKKEL
jgi:DNA-binding transcriptional ArsR family regulator